MAFKVSRKSMQSKQQHERTSDSLWEI